ncbi:MAG: polysaccharide biosynthesis C-terminal domain-containing protein [Clostridia bacterium]|nr:polysaccharide biosynthesis C-terminal domain-containing protein [Clostridia bacterium]
MLRLFRNSFILSFTTKFSIAFFGLIETIVVARYLGSALRGEYAFIFNTVNIFAIILNLGVYQTYPYFKRKGENNIKEKIYAVVFIQFVVFSLAALILSLLTGNLRIILIATLTPLMILAKQLNFITLVDSLIKRNFISILNGFVSSLVLVLFFLFTQRNMIFVVIVLYFKEVFIITVTIFYFRLYHYFALSARLDFAFIKKCVKFGFFPMLTFLLITLNYRADVIILSVMVDSHYVGLYQVGVQLAEKIWLFSDSFKEVLFSRTAREDAVETILLSIKINIVIGLSALLTVAIFGKSILLLLFGSEFVDAYRATIIIFGGVIGMIFFKLIYPLFISKGKQKMSFMVMGACVAINIGLNIVLIPVFGMEGSALASLISYSFCGGVFMKLFLKEYNLPLMKSLMPTKQDIEVIYKVFKRKKYNHGEKI